MYFKPLEKKLPPSSPTYSSVPERNKDSPLLSPTTPQWLTRRLMLPLPPTPVIHLTNAPVADHSIFPIESYPASDTVRSSPLPPCYSPSIYLIPSWRESSITLFEEDIQPTGLGIRGGLDLERGSSRASIPRVYASKVAELE